MSKIFKPVLSILLKALNRKNYLIFREAFDNIFDGFKYRSYV